MKLFFCNLKYFITQHTKEQANCVFNFYFFDLSDVCPYFINEEIRIQNLVNLSQVNSARVKKGTGGLWVIGIHGPSL